MKKHFILTSLFAFTAILNAQTQTLVAAERQTPGFGFEKIQREVEQRSGAYNARGYDPGSDDRCDCDKCRIWKKSKKHGACGKPGKHYGKHKHRGKHNDYCHHSRCESRKNRTVKIRIVGRKETGMIVATMTVGMIATTGATGTVTMGVVLKQPVATATINIAAIPGHRNEKRFPADR